MPRRVCIKNTLTCILKSHVSEIGAQFGSARNAFGITHSDSERNSHPYFKLAILWQLVESIENCHSKWILRRCKIEHIFGTAKSCPKHALKKQYKTWIILIIWTKLLKIMIFTQRDLKCILKNKNIGNFAHFYMANLLLALGISEFRCLFFFEF